MSASPPVDTTAPEKKATLKKNTVDYIASKISYDTAIPVSIFEDRREFIERCKPYDIIDGPNPLDDPDGEAAPHANGSGSGSASSATAVKAERSASTSTRSSRKRSRSPLRGAAKVKAEAEEDNGKPAVAFTRPTRPGWAKEQLHESRPYQLLRSRDMETRVRYVLDDIDFDWCAAHGIAPEVLQRGVTYLEWAYVSALLTAATPHIEDAVAAGPSSAFTSSSATVVDDEGRAMTVQHSNGATSVRAHAQPVQRAKRGGGRSGHHGALQGGNSAAAAAAAAAATTCALCSKSVQLLLSSQHQPQQPTSSGGGRGGRGGRGRGGRGGSTTASSSRSTLSSAAGGGRGSGTATDATGTFPSCDLQHQGLRCCECGVVAHLRCWFLTEPPKLPDAWTCDGCTNYAQHRKRSAGVCCMCGRMGGVLLPYVSSSLKEDNNSNHNSNVSVQPSASLEECDPPSPLSPQLTHHSHHLHHQQQHGTYGATPVALTDMVCHAVCALTMPELAIHNTATVLRRNGLVDMEARPYVYALRRVGKQRYAMHCVFCEHGGTGRCVQCHHPHCFEAMHASCAAEAHTVDCHAETPGSPSSSSFPPSVMVAAGEASASAFAADSVNGPFSPGGVSLNGGAPPLSWASCSTYCRKHYGYSVSSSFGSAALGDRAEAEALGLDLTGLLTGGDGITSPVVKKRGRGRPPVALVQQREAERELIVKLHVYWRERREQRRQSSGQLVSEINARLRPVVEAMLRPEIVKVSADKVRLSHFLSLVPEWQWQLVAVVEGELPLPDEEYDDVQKYRKVAHTRRSGNTRSLYDKMSVAATQLDLMCRITEAMKQECRLRRTSAELEAESLRKLCGWKS